jgi:hypothetical protein
MRTEDRLKEILARQAAAAKVEKDSEAEAKIVAGQLNELREAVTQNWPVRRAHIAAFVAKLNSQMKKNGHQLFVMESDSVSSHTGLEVDKMELGFEPKTRSHKKLLLSVRPNGEVYVSMGTRGMAAAKSYKFNLLEASDEQLEETVLDFLDINTPQ